MVFHSTATGLSPLFSQVCYTHQEFAIHRPLRKTGVRVAQQGNLLISEIGIICTITPPIPLYKHEETKQHDDKIYDAWLYDCIQSIRFHSNDVFSDDSALPEERYYNKQPKKDIETVIY